MESMISYRFGTLPHQSIHMSSGYNAAITAKRYCFSHFSTKPHLSFGHSSSSLPKSSRGRPLGHILGPITFTAGRPSTSLTDQKCRPPQAQDFTAAHLEKVEEVAEELKRSTHQGIALQLLKIHDRELDSNTDLVGCYKIKTAIMQILIDEKRFNEALTYSGDIEAKRSIFPPKLDLEKFNKLQEQIPENLRRQHSSH